LVLKLKNEGYPVMRICKILKISRSSYYANGSPKDEAKLNRRAITEAKYPDLLERIKKIKEKHLYWGYRRVWALLRFKEGLSVSQGFIYRFMKKNNMLLDVKHHKAKRTVQKEKPKAEKVNQWWGTDMTKFYVNSVGWVYLVIVLDWFSKMVVAYKLNLRSKSEDWISALQEAVQLRCPGGSREYSLNLISDNGSQPTSRKYESIVGLLGINHITTSYSNPKGNADTERFMRTFKEEVVYANEFDSFEEAAEAVNYFIKYYNEEYLHSTLGYLSPVEFEKQLYFKNVAYFFSTIFFKKLFYFYEALHM
jgi:putative transposase